MQSSSSTNRLPLATIQEFLAEIRTTFHQVLHFTNSGELLRTKAPSVLSSLQSDLQQNVIQQLESYSSSGEMGHEDLLREAQAIGESIDAAKENLADSFQGLSISEQSSSAAGHAPTQLQQMAMQQQKQLLVNGMQVFPRSLANRSNTCSEQALCTAAFIFNSQGSQVDLSHLRLRNSQVDLIQMAMMLNPEQLPRQMSSFDVELLNQLDPARIYLVHMGARNSGHNTIWFNFDGNWYQSASSHIPLLQLTQAGAVTQEARRFFDQRATLAGGWGHLGFGIHLLELLPEMPGILISQLNEIRRLEHS